MKTIIILSSLFIGFFIFMVGIAGIEVEEKQDKNIKTKLTAHFIDILATYGLITYFAMIFERWDKDKPYPQIAFFGIIITLGSMVSLIVI